MSINNIEGGKTKMTEKWSAQAWGIKKETYSCMHNWQIRTTTIGISENNLKKEERFQWMDK